MRLHIVFVTLLFVLATAWADSPCPTCATFANAAAAHLTLAMQDPLGQTVSIIAYTENLSASPSRVGINNTIIIVEVTNSTTLRELYKTYTDDQGIAAFDFSSSVLPSNYQGCIDIKALYCPFCTNPDACGFAQCLNYSRISGDSGYYSNINGPVSSPSDIPPAPAITTTPSPLNPNQYFPDLQVMSYCTPPPPLASTPAICLPLLIIFSLLSGALYLTGKNPFAGFNIGSQRVGRHIRYQARGRGFSMNVMSVISAVTTVTDSVKAAKKGKLAETEKQKASSNVFIAGTALRGLAGAKKLVSVMSVAGKAAGKSKGFSNTINTFGRVTDSGMARTTGAARGAQQVATAGGGMMMAPGGGGSALRVADLSSNRLVGVFQVGMFLLANSYLGRCITSIASWGSWGSNAKMSYEINLASGLLNHDSRARQDLRAMKDVMNADGTVTVELPGGRTATARDVQVFYQPVLNSDGTPKTDALGNPVREVVGARLVLDPMPGSGISGQVTVNLDRNGTVTSMSFMAPHVNAEGQPIRDSQGRPVQTMYVASMDSQNPNGPLRYSSSSDGGRNFTPVQANDRIGDVRVADAFNGALAGSAMYVGGNARDLLNSVAATQSVMADMSASLTAETGNVRAQAEQRISDEAQRTPEGRQAIQQARYDTATRELALSLGFSESDLRTGGQSQLFSGLGEHGHEQAVTAIGGAWSSTFGSSAFAAQATGGVPVGDRPAVEAALGRIVGGSTVQQLAALGNPNDPAALRSALILQMAGANPTPESLHRAETTVAALPSAAISGIASSLQQGASNFNQQMAAGGCPPELRTAASQVASSQLNQLSQTANDLGNPAALLARNPGNPELPSNLRGMLDEHAHIVAVDAGAQNMNQQLASGRMNPTAMGAMTYTQEQFDRLTFTTTAHNVADSGIYQQADPVGDNGHRVSEDISSGTSDMATAARYSSHFVDYDPTAAQQYGQAEQRARDTVVTALNSGNVAEARAIAQSQANNYAAVGDTQASQAWSSVATQLEHPPATPDPIIATLNRAAPPEAVGRREAEIVYSSGQETNARVSIAEAVNSGNYASAEAQIADRIRYYRDVGDERSALVYELARTQVTGLRTNQYFDPDWARANPDAMPEAVNHARDQILSDIGVQRHETPVPGSPTPRVDYQPTSGLGGTAERMTGRSISASSDLERRGEATIADATVRMDGELSARGTADSEVRGMRRGPTDSYEGL